MSVDPGSMARVEQPFEPSPVPSDARLWPHELPFTAFGQWGAGWLDLRVFDQDIWWVDYSGTPHRLDEMPEDYRLNVIMFLREWVVDYHQATVRRASIQAAGDALLGYVPHPYLDARTINDTDPGTWLEATPLMRGLRARTGV